MKFKVVIATGGTGGHVFPAQALGAELLEMGYEVLFVGGGLETNRYFNRARFLYRQIASATPFKGNWFKSLYLIGKGIWQSLNALRQFHPDIVMGFGSYHSFPVLSAARWKKIPIVLFVPDAIPGRVNRFFSKKALFSAVQFSVAGEHLKGKIVEVKMPMMKKTEHNLASARDYFYLDPHLFTFLVFGGSQGSESINTLFANSIAKVAAEEPFQVIHIAGKSQSAEQLRRQYEQAGIRACVKVFEEQMDLAWSAADVVVCRSGAATLAELIAFGRPGILIPFPRAADDHQTKNALFIEKNIGGAVACPESSLTTSRLKELLEQFMIPERLKQMKAAITSFKQDMRKPALSTLICKYHFIGIGGIGMSALARILLQRGATVQGSDPASSYVTEDLQKAGAKIFNYHSSEHLSAPCKTVYNSMIKPEHPEYVAALKNQFPLLHRSDLLAELMEGYLPLLVTGTHGKTTTSCLLTHVLQTAGYDPTFALGGVALNSYSNGEQGKGIHFVAEADESDGTFLKYPAHGAIITNIEEDHLDYWKTREALIEGFRRFAVRVPGLLWWCADDPILSSLNLQSKSYGESSKADLCITSWHQKGFELGFDVVYAGKTYSNLSLPLLGHHNVANGAAVLGMALDLGVPEQAIRKAFTTFKGVKRRLEKKGSRLYDDYAHHPTEIVTTLRGLRQAVGEKRIVAVFQPHRYTRVRDCWKGFMDAFKDADLLLITDIWSAGEAPIAGFDVARLTHEMEQALPFPVHYIPRTSLVSGLKKLIRPHDVVITLGAGDVTDVCSYL